MHLGFWFFTVEQTTVSKRVRLIVLGPQQHVWVLNLHLVLIPEKKVEMARITI